MTQHRGEAIEADDSALGDVWPHALLPFVASRVFMFAVAAFANSYLLPWAISHDLETRGITLLTRPWDRFDAGFFLDVAQNGYGAAGNANWAVFPVFPVLVHVLALVLGGSQGAFLLSAILIANLSAAGATALLYLLVRAEWGVEIAKRTAWYFVFVPFGFYLAAPYPDSLFVLLAVGMLLLTRQHRWLAAGTLGALAAATRAPGTLLALVIVTELVVLWRSNRRTGRPTPVARGMLAAAMVPAGLVAFLAYGKVKTGDWLVTQSVSANVWGRDITDPADGVKRLLDSAHWGQPASYLFSPANTLLLVILGYALIRGYRRFAATYTAFTAVLVAAAISYGSLQSLGRTSLPIVPGLVLLAILTRSETSPRHQIALVGFAIANAVLLVCFVLNIPAVS